ncbi:MAG: 16S rRNA (guanine(966)-N(2))-methyltransferase RsmD [Culicoidibacterales bacterium]
MKITSGKYRNRNIETLEGSATRPTSSKIRSAIFNALGQHFTGGRVLDLFSGSGAMMFEAISRGFASGVCVDSSIAAIKVIKKNIALLGLEEQIEVRQNDYQYFLKISQEALKFDLIIVDPPYEMKVVSDIITLIDTLDLLGEAGTLVFEYSNKIYNDIKAEVPSNFTVVFERKYDATSVIMLVKQAGLTLKEEIE